jgi:hypothetical protein
MLLHQILRTCLPFSLIQVLIPGDSAEPGRQRTVPAKAVNPLHRLIEGLLRNVFRQMRIP